VNHCTFSGVTATISREVSAAKVDVCDMAQIPIAVAKEIVTT